LNGWAPIVGVCTATTGSGGSSTTVLFFLNASNGGTFYMWGNQIAEPGWAFIPGPNNPACTAAGTCNLTADQLEEARRDQYHGCVPPGVAPGTLSTCETFGTSNLSDVNNTGEGAGLALVYNSFYSKYMPGGLSSLSAGVVYSHAGTQLPSCSSLTVLPIAQVSDATSLTPGTAYSPSAGAGSDKVFVQCAYNGSAYAWQTM